MFDNNIPFKNDTAYLMLIVAILTFNPLGRPLVVNGNLPMLAHLHKAHYRTI